MTISLIHSSRSVILLLIKAKAKLKQSNNIDKGVFLSTVTNTWQ